MSAVNFRLDVRRFPDSAGDRAVVVLDGKFLLYEWSGRSPRAARPSLNGAGTEHPPPG